MCYFGKKLKIRIHKSLLLLKFRHKRLCIYEIYAILRYVISSPPQAVRKVGISKQNRHPTMFWKGWNWLMRYFSDRLPQ